MAIQNIRIWQWMFIGILVGFISSLAWNMGSSDGEGASTWSVSSFAGRLAQKTDTGDPVLTNIVIDPMMLDVQHREVQRVHFTLMAHNRVTNTWMPYEDASIAVIMPLVSDKPDYRIQDFLKEQKAQTNPKITYRYAWWKLSDISADRETFPWQRSKFSWIALPAVGFVLIGLLWPMVIQSLIKMGVVPEPDIRPDLSKVRNVKAKPMEKTGTKVTDDDLASLDALNAKLEANVGDMLINADERDEAAERKQEAAVIKKLSGVALEQQTTQQAEESKEYQGEYYPVVKPHHDEGEKKH